MKTMIYILMAFVILCAPAQAMAKLLDIKEVTSPSGITAWLVEDHSVPVISMQFAFKGIGAALDPADKQGLSQLVSNTMDEGAGEMNSEAFQKALKNFSIDLRFTSSRDSFGGILKTITNHKHRAFDLLTLAMTDPRFDEEPLKRMKNSNMSRIRSALSNPEWVAARIQNDKAYAGHPYAQNSGGTLTTLQNITPDDLRGFVSKFSRERLVVAVAGDITEQELSQILDKIFGHLPQSTDIQSPPPVTLQNQGTTFSYDMNTPQSVVEIIQPGINRKDPDYQTAQVMNFILGSSGFGSRLMAEAREKRGLTYGIYTSIDSMRLFDSLSLSTSTKNESVGEMLDIIHAEWDRMKSAPVTEKELKSAKSYLIGSLPLGLTSTDKIAALLATLQEAEMPIDYLDTREEKIQATTTADIQRVANRLLDTQKFVTVLVGKPAGAKNVTAIDTLANVE